MKKIVVGMGEALFDCLPGGKQIGGAPANFAFHVSQLGLDGRVVSAVGRDADGRDILRILEERGLRTLIEQVEQPTGTVQVSLDEQGVPCYDIKRDVAWDNIPFTPQLEQLAREAQAVCWGSLAQRSSCSRATMLKFLDTMPDGGDRLKIFDINLRQQFYTKEVIEQSAKRCNVLKINDEELAELARLMHCPHTGERDRARHFLHAYGLRTLILTCGTRGSWIFGPDGESFMETPQVEVADTVGAGDAFTAAFVAATLSGWDMTEAHRLAVKVSAYVCTCHGAMPLLPADWRLPA